MLSMEPLGLRPKNFQTSLVVPPAPLRIHSQRPLAPNVASVTSVPNDKGDNEMILGAVHRKPQLEEPSDEGAVRPVIISNGVPFLKIRSAGSHSKSGREKKGIKERTGCQ